MRSTDLYSKARWWLLAAIFISQAVVLYFSPEERTLGAGIKPVYLHVSLTWAGMLLLFLTAMLALVGVVWVNAKLASWQRTLFVTGLLLYGVGLLISLYASWVNWGGIPVMEPRIRTAINVVVAGIAAWALREMLPWARLKSAAGMLPVLMMVFSVQSNRIALHPDSPVSTSPPGIKTAFYLMFGLAALLSIWLVAYQRADSQK